MADFGSGEQKQAEKGLIEEQGEGRKRKGMSGMIHPQYRAGDKRPKRAG